ncbi:hypothetical protein GCM10011362_05310 [Marinobacter halophilus]|nr:hypothetical protein GCM10011362_05310 [Marinobacter halophilus]
MLSLVSSSIDTPAWPVTEAIVESSSGVKSARAGKEKLLAARQAIANVDLDECTERVDMVAPVFVRRFLVVI